MNKKILIASIFATLMLLVPTTSVVGVSYVNEDCGCQVVSSINLVRVERLLARLEVYINIILLRFGYIPEVADKCYEILDVINSNIQLDFPIICDILESIYNQLLDTLDSLARLLSEFKDNPIIQGIIFLLVIPVDSLSFIVLILGHFFGCEGWPP